MKEALGFQTDKIVSESCGSIKIEWSAKSLLFKENKKKQ
jgi:hypothetical protein